MSADRDFSFRSVLPTLIWDALLPYVAYTVMKSQMPEAGELAALGVSAVPPAIHGVYSVVRKGHVDIIGAIVLAGIVVSAVAMFIGGDPKMVLIRESFVTVVVGVICLTSLLWPRPLMFFVARQFTVGQDPEGIAWFNGLWARPGARQMFRILTVVWGVGWVGEFVLRVILVQMLTIPEMLAVGPIVFNGITFGLIAWTIWFSRHRRKMAEKLDAEEAARAAAAASSQGAVQGQR